MIKHEFTGNSGILTCVDVDNKGIMFRKKQATHFIGVLDRSYSMKSVWAEAVNAFNDQIRVLKEATTEKQEIVATLIVFDDKIDVLCECSPMGNIAGINGGVILPRGSTALIDAMYKAILIGNEWLHRNSNYQDNDDAVFVCVTTDGHENSSRDYNLQQLKSLHEEAEGAGRFTFSFVGGARGLSDFARGVGLNTNAARSFTCTPEGILKASSVVNTASVNYMTSRSQGALCVSDVYNGTPENLSEEV